jgi:hypothetical protein
MNLGFKLAVVAGFATVLGYRGGTAFDPLAASAHQADSQTRVAPIPVESSAAPSTAQPPETPPSDGVLSAVAPETTRDEAAGSFAAEVRRLSSEADEVDQLWRVYKVRCGVRVGRQYPFGREWFSIFDRAAEQTIAAPGCDEEHRRVRQQGEKVGRGIERARTAAHQAFLDRATENGMLRWHALHWPQFDDDAEPRRRDEQKPYSTPARSAER